MNVLKNWMEISFNDFQITSVKQIFDDFVESLPVDTYGKKLKDQMIRVRFYNLYLYLFKIII